MSEIFRVTSKIRNVLPYYTPINKRVNKRGVVRRQYVRILISRLIMKCEYAQFFIEILRILKSYSIKRVPVSRKVMLKTMKLLPYGSFWNMFNILYSQ
jgi:hypothetical protein